MCIRDSVGALIASLRQTNPGESIAVLAASRTHTLLIAEQLRTAGIAYTGVKLTPLIETPVIRDLEALTRVLLCLLYTSPSPRDRTRSRMPSSA